MKGLFILVAILGTGYFPDAQSYPDPEYFNEVYACRKDSNILIRLEKEISTIDTKVKKSSVESSYSLDKERSTVRISNLNHFSFVFREDSAILQTTGPVDDSDSEPSFHSLLLYKMESSKGKRKTVTMSMNMSSQKSGQTESVPLSFKRIRKGYYEITIDKPLTKGEYAFVTKKSDDFTNHAVIFAFGVE